MFLSRKKRRKNGVFYFHPGSLLAVIFLLLVFLQAQSGTVLFAITGLLFCLCLLVSRGGIVRRLQRAQWLFLMIFIFFGWLTSGRYIFPALGFLSPTVEGIFLALEHSSRLLVAFSGVALIFQVTSKQTLLGAIHGYLHFFRVFGLNPERAVGRISLVLQYIETPETRLTWRSWFEPMAGGNRNLPETICIQTCLWRLRDGLLAVAVMVWLLWILR